MRYAIDKLVAELETAVQKIAGTAAKIEPANPKFGADLAVPCFVLGRDQKKNPAEAAQWVAAELKHGAIDRLESVGPYVNIWLKPAALAKQLDGDISLLAQHNKQYGEYINSNPQTVVVEFPSPNIAKPFSVAHLRPAVQGWALRQLMLAMGHKVITDDHLGDSGTPFGKWVVGFLRYSSEAALTEQGIYELARVYIQITKDLKEEKEADGHELADQVQHWLLKLEQGDPKAVAFSKKFTQVSLKHIGVIYKRLGIHTDHAMGEAGFVASGKQLVAEMVKKGIAQKQPDGAIIVRLEGFDTPMLAQKSNGAANYVTTDIATLDYRMSHWHPDTIIHVVGAEQQFHFNQLFALAKKLGYTKTDFVHYWFGIIDQINDDGTRSKMSSRKGVVLLEDLLDKAEAEAHAHASDLAKSDPESIRRIAVGAVKFNDFAQDRKTNMLFDWQTMFNLQGFSGPYIQYAAVRVGGILQKFGEGKPHAQYDWLPEHDLLLQVAKYPMVVREAATEYEPHRIAAYLYELARTLNRYYENTPVGDAEAAARSARLWLLAHVRNIFVHGLGLLGIEVPNKM